MENWKLLLAGIRNALTDLVSKTFNVNGSVEVSNLADLKIEKIVEISDKVEVSNLVDYKEELNKIIGELIKVPKDIKTADYTPIIKALQEVVKTLEADKTDYSPIILAIESAVKELKTQYPEVDYSPIINTIKGIQQFNLSQYLEEGELPVIINEKQIKKLVDAFGKKTGQVVAASMGGGTDNTGIINAINSTAVTYAIQLAVKSTDSTITYIGKAIAGSSLASAVWQIKRMTDTSGDLSIEFADGDTNFNNIWNSREALTYS